MEEGSAEGCSMSDDDGVCSQKMNPYRDRQTDRDDCTKRQWCDQQERPHDAIKRSVLVVQSRGVSSSSAIV